MSIALAISVAGDLTAAVNDFLNKGTVFAFALGIMGAVCTGLIDWFLEMGWGPQTATLVFDFSMLWHIPIALYLIYHRLTLPLPICVTFGQPLALGGIVSDTCDGSNYGSWPCFTHDLKVWLGSLIRLESWSQVFKPEMTVVLFLIFVAGNILWLRSFAKALRYDPQLAKAKEEEKRKNAEADAKLLELSDKEKQ